MFVSSNDFMALENDVKYEWEKISISTTSAQQVQEISKYFNSDQKRRDKINTKLLDSTTGNKI